MRARWSAKSSKTKETFCTEWARTCEAMPPGGDSASRGGAWDRVLTWIQASPPTRWRRTTRTVPHAEVTDQAHCVRRGACAARAPVLFKQTVSEFPLLYEPLGGAKS